MSVGSKQLIIFFTDQINNLRQKPSNYAKTIQKRLNSFIDETSYQRNDIPNVLYKTEQGKHAVQEAVNYLSSFKSLSPLFLSMQLCEIAYNISLSLNKHDLSEQKLFSPENIASEASKLHCKVQNLQIIVQYGFRKDVQIVPSIVIDDGDPSRLRRGYLLNPNNKFIGIGVQQHKQYDFILIILLCDNLVLEKQDCQCNLI